jgi:carboxymethylenebutenolidase
VKSNGEDGQQQQDEQKEEVTSHRVAPRGDGVVLKALCTFCNVSAMLEDRAFRLLPSSPLRTVAAESIIDRISTLVHWKEGDMSGEMVKYGENGRFNGYLAIPEGAIAPAVLVLHAWWGLNDFFKSLCDRLAAAGYAAFAPDLFDGRIATTVDEAMSMEDVRGADFVEEAAIASVPFLAQLPSVRHTGIGAMGFSFGAAWATVLSTVYPQDVRAVVLFYGAYAPDLTRATASYLGHFAEVDDWEPREGVEELKAALEAAGRVVTFHTYPGTGHWFFEPDRPDAYNREAAQLAWDRTLAFLKEHLG